MLFEYALLNMVKGNDEPLMSIWSVLQPDYNLPKQFSYAYFFIPSEIRMQMMYIKLFTLRKNICSDHTWLNLTFYSG